MKQETATSGVVLVVPAYNEQDSIVNLIERVQEAGYDYIVVNDGSRDNTLQLCREHDFNVLDLHQNLGIGGAVQSGYRYALDNGYDIAIQFDGDGQHEVSSIPMLLKKIDEGYDLVIGSRFISEENQFKSTFMRRVGIRWLQMMLKVTTGQTITDPTSGFRACNRKTLEMFANDYPIDYPEPESIAKAIKHHLHIAEVPALMHERQGGSSSIGGLSSVYYMIKVSLAVLMAGIGDS